LGVSAVGCRKNSQNFFLPSYILLEDILQGDDWNFKNIPSTWEGRFVNNGSNQEIQTVARQLVATTERGTKAIANRLTSIRKEQGITQVEMAKKLKTTQSVYSRYESGEFRLHGELLLAMAKILAVTPNDILGVTKSGNTKAPLSEYNIPKRVLRRLRGIEDLTRTDQDYLLRTIDAFMTAGRKKRTKKAEATI